MKKTLSLLFLLGAVVTVLVAQAPAVNNSVAAGPALDSRIDALLAMSATERRNELKALDPQQRKGLWFEVKREQVRRQGQQTATRGQYIDPTPINVKPKKPLTRAIGTIGYDSGFPTIGFGGGAIIGNRFDTHTGIPVFASGTVSSVQAQVVPGSVNTTSSAGFVLLGPQTTSGGAFALFSTFTTATGVIDSLSFTGLGVNYTGSSFFVLFGDFASVYIPVFGTGSTLGQGHHGVVGYTGGMGPNITSTFDFGDALNSFIRATGNIVPVELMTFDVE